MKRIGIGGAFYHCGLTEIVIPNGVEEICDKSFSMCEHLSCLTFEGLSSLKWIGIEAFFECGLIEIHIPDSAEELCDKCFCSCARLSGVTFGALSSLKSIGSCCFQDSGLLHVQCRQVSFQWVVPHFLSVLSPQFGSSCY